MEFLRITGEPWGSSRGMNLTQYHPLLILGKWVPASALKVGDRMTAVDGSKRTVFSVQKFDESVIVYNF
jgi:Pretoxin HINT domain